MDKKVLSNYQEIIPKYFENEFEDSKRVFQTFKSLFNFLDLNYLHSKIKLLDIGSGNGSFVEICKENNIDAIGIDGSKQKINFENDKLDFKDETFEVVTLISVIEHIQEPSNILREVYRILKKKGVIVIVTPNFRYSYKNFYDDPTHLRPYTEKSIIKLMQLYGFKNLKTVPFLVNKSLIFWKIPFSFFFASILPLKNHQLKKIPFVDFLKGKSTAMISVSEKI